MPSQPLPPFPSSVPTAPLLEISLSALQRHDVAEENRLWDAACSLGFFYLDLRPDGELGRAENGEANGDAGERVDGEKLLADADGLFGVAEELFCRPLEEKQRFDFAEKGSYFG
jgi:hypothetical protein